MVDRRNKIIAVIFCLIIFTFGLGTVMKCGNQFKDIVENHKLFSATEIIEQSIQNNFKSRNNWINLNGLFQRLVGTTIVQGVDNTDVYKLENGQLMYNLGQQDMHSYAEKVDDLYHYVNKKDIDLMYVQLPFKIENDNVMPVGAKEYGNDNADELLECLKSKGIETIDIRESIHKENLAYKDLFFNTDHHWKPATAIWAAGIIADKLRENYDMAINMEMYDLKQYNVTTYDNWFLGSLGKRTGVFYGGVDDFDMITPKFKTDFEFWAKSSNGIIKRSGNFQQSMLKMDYIKKKDYFNINNYAGYIGGDYELNLIENKLAANDKKILLLRDSFSCTLLPYLSLAAKTITAIDLRHYNDMSLVEYIDKNEFDIILIAYNPSAFSEEQFAFFGH